MATSVDGSTPASASASSPGNTVLLNLAAYMYEAYKGTYPTSLEAAINFAPMMENGALVVKIDNANGVYAEAFESTGPGPKQVVVAYEGTKSFFQGNQFTVGQLIDDTQLWGGKFADSFKTSADFAAEVVSLAASQGIAKDEVFVTGHSLGAADAEYAASAVGLGGAAYAGPGINTAFTGSLPPTITDYVDAGDPVGNYAADGNDVLASVLVSNNIKHYGNLDVLPNFNGQLTLAAASAAFGAGGPRQKQAAFLGAIAAAGKNHLVSRYANDLGVKLYVNDESEGASGFFGTLGANGATGTQDAVGFTSGTGLGTTMSPTPAQEVDLQPYDVIANHNQGDTTFVFSQGDGLDVVRGFKVGGADHDTMALPSADFQNFAAVLRNTGDVNGSAFITDPKTGDAIRLAGVTTAELKAHPKDFTFFG